MQTESEMAERFQKGLRERTKQYCVSKQKRIESRIKVFTFIAWAFVVFGFGAAAYPIPRLVKDGVSLENLGRFGSYLQGSVSSLWALSGLMFIYTAFLMQRLEFLQQAVESQDQEAKFLLQQESIKQQNFESAFFHLLASHNQLVSEMKEGDNTFGKACFQRWHSTFARDFEDWLRRKNLNPAPEHLANRENVLNFYHGWQANHEALLGPYFRNLYHLIKFVKDSDLKPDEKESHPNRRYTSLVRAQFSKFEALFLFYNCLGQNQTQFKALVEEFGLLEHLDQKNLLHPSHSNFYKESVFKQGPGGLYPIRERSGKE